MSETKRILVVDDEAEALKAIEGFIKSFGHKTESAQDGEEALLKLKQGIDLVLLDIRMPRMDGYEVIRCIRGNPTTSDIPIIMVTALGGKIDRLRAVKAGANDFIQKPIDVVELKVRMDSLLKIKASQDEIKRQRAMLEETNKKLENAYEFQKDLLENTLKGTVNILVEVLSLRNPLAFSQATRMKNYVRQLCGKLEIRNSWQFELAALLSQIGCVTIPTEILEKFYAGDTLTSEENAMVLSHAVVGRGLLSNVPRLEMIANIVGMQNESFFNHLFTQEPKRRPPDLLGGQLLKTVYDYDLYICRGMSHRDALKNLRRSSQASYDPYILSALTDIDVDPSGDSSGFQLKIINVNQLAPGMILAQDLLTKNDTTLARKGQEVAAPLLRLLKNYLQRKGMANVTNEIQIFVPKSEVKS
ncbi:two-component system response regulator [Nitrospinota bacterium]